MSFAHIQLKKTKEENGFAFFSVLSPDFNEDMAWQEVAEVVVNCLDGTFDFHPKNAWENLRIVPPHIYELEDWERERALAFEFSDHQHGAWSGRIISMVRKLHPKIMDV